ncbi:pyocin knob domain-containing protein [Paracoccus aestuariivivens]|uniref:Putative tail fiber protein gp53-like C-terminal domain-containing protein n=1 Tax=Paracoccus aestuariivivens TaxID=1820333 RepID=A0A6L6JC23_9RHOB|nr:pyocin knob domain-containing protein [Paracoccus aestuariivivens]MTH78755.1 hypothetical protein [Paracoccus aestuariivivens]
MADLPELAEWIAGIYQIEQTDPVLGGAPNETTGAGLTNIPALQLAKRTLWLKQLVENAGIGVQTLVSVTSFDAITAGGLYVGAGTAAGSPDSAANAVVLHIPSNNANAAFQIAGRIGTINRLWMRRKQAGAWAAWVEVMTGSNVQTSATDATAGRLLSVGAFGVGATVSPVISNINDSSLVSGMYRTTLADTVSGAFPSGVTGDGRTGVLQVHRLDGGSLLQSWRQIFSDAVWERRFTTAAWTPWRRVWDGVSADYSATTNGYQRLPSGLILQWGGGATESGGSTAVVFPIAFPTAVHTVVVSDVAVALTAGNAHIISTHGETRTGFTALGTTFDGSIGPTQFKYFAVGS